MSFLRLLGGDSEYDVNTNQISSMFAEVCPAYNYIKVEGTNDMSPHHQESLANNNYVNTTQNIMTSEQGMPFNSNIITETDGTAWSNLNEAFIHQKVEPEDVPFYSWDNQKPNNSKKRKSFEAFPQEQEQQQQQTTNSVSLPYALHIPGSSANQQPPPLVPAQYTSGPESSQLNLVHQMQQQQSTGNNISQWFPQNRLQSVTGRQTDFRMMTSTEQPGTKKQRLLLNLTFENLPDYIFDTSTIPVRSLVSIADPQTTDEAELYDMYKDLYFLVAPVNICEAKFVEVELQQLDIDSQIAFSHDLFKKLPGHKVFVLWIQVWSYSSGKMITEGATPTITLLHDGLKETPPQITADVCFFPQKVVIAHLKNCNSKATLSKRHKKGKIKEGSTWCRNPKNCASKGSCGCQAYPSRILKKGVRELKLLLEKSEAPQKVIQCAAELYSILSQTADKQTEKIPHYDSFLKERIKRWKLFMRLKEFIDSGQATKDAVEKFRFIYGLLPNPDAQGQGEQHVVSASM